MNRPEVESVGGQTVPPTAWEKALVPFLESRRQGGIRLFLRTGVPVDPTTVQVLAGADVFLEPGVPAEGWLPVDADPPEPEEPLGAVVCLGNTVARDILTVFGRAYRWLESGGLLVLLDYFSNPRVQDASDGALVLMNVLSLGERAGFDIEGNVAVELGWSSPPIEPGLRLMPRMLVFRKTKKSVRWRVTYQEPGRSHEVRALFRKVFGQEMSESLWSWKYGEGRGQGALALRDNQVVAHYGGLTRRIRFRGRPARGGQVADVMVDPNDRGILTRKGAFFLAAASIPETCSGFGSKHLIGFGFPSHRHHRLAERLDLYREVERITQLHWPALESRGSAYITQALTALPEGRARRLVERLWSAMALDLRDAIVGERDYAWLRYRYLEHPSHRYDVVIVRSGWWRRLLGIAVLRVHEENVELMDLVGPLRLMADVVRALRYRVNELGRRELYCWITSEKAKWLGMDEAIETDPDVCIPTSIRTPGPDADDLRSRWWLMSGDTDFR